MPGFAQPLLVSYQVKRFAGFLLTFLSRYIEEFRFFAQIQIQSSGEIQTLLGNVLVVFQLLLH